MENRPGKKAEVKTAGYSLRRGAGQGLQYGRKIPFRPVPRPETLRPPPFFSLRKQRVYRIGPQAVQGAKRRSGPLTARTDPAQ